MIGAFFGIFALLFIVLLVDCIYDYVLEDHGSLPWDGVRRDHHLPRGM